MRVKNKSYQVSQLPGSGSAARDVFGSVRQLTDASPCVVHACKHQHSGFRLSA